MLADGVIPIRDTRGVAKSEYMKPLGSTMSLTANDCYELGRQAYYNEDYHHARLWMSEALRRKETEENTEQSAKDRVDILEYLAFSQYKLGHLQEAYEYTLQMLAYDPDHERGKMNLFYYEKEMAEEKITPRKAKKGDDGDEAIPTENTISESKWPHEESERQTYEALCRGENRMSERVRSKLVCFYLDTRRAHPYIRLARIKVEEAYKRPQIVVVLDFLSDEEVETIKTLAKPKLKRATVQNYFTGNLEVAKYRISKSAWLTNREHEIVGRVRRRVEAYTGLDRNTGEELQVVNYGIGGHYEPHYDFARREEKNAFASLGKSIESSFRASSYKCYCLRFRYRKSNRHLAELYERRSRGRRYSVPTIGRHSVAEEEFGGFLVQSVQIWRRRSIDATRRLSGAGWLEVGLQPMAARTRPRVAQTMWTF